MAFERRLVNLAAGIYDRLTGVKRELEAEKGREVTYTETVEYLLDYRDAKTALMQEAGR